VEEEGTIILKINQALYFRNQLSHILLNQNQMQTLGLTVDQCPKHLAKGRSLHPITIDEPNYDILPHLNGIISYFDARTPTRDKLLNCTHIDITLRAVFKYF
jgi:hypothetical protein